MPKFISIQRDFSVDDLKVDIVEAKDVDTAWEEAEMKYSNSDTQTWILTTAQTASLATKLRKILFNHAI